MNYSIYQDFKSRVYLFNPDNLIMYLKVLFFSMLGEPENDAAS